MSEHTPGPWKEHITDQGKVYIVNKGKLVDHTVMRYEEVCYIGDMEDTTAEDHANATLIAAAPDLLAALEKLDDAIGHEWVSEHVAFARDEAIAAISKARGF